MPKTPSLRHRSAIEQASREIRLSAIWDRPGIRD
jgi:hypothetical protein